MQNKIIDALRRNAVDEAVSLAREWSASATASAEPLRWLAIVLKRQADHEGALAALDQAIAIAPEDSSLHLERALMLLGGRRLDEAGTALERSTELNPNQFHAYLVQAQLALGRGDLDEAQRLNRMAARIEPEHPQLATIEGIVALRRGQSEQALSILTLANRRAPNDPHLLYALGFAYMARQHWAFAEQAFRRVVEEVPDTAGLNVLIAQLAQRQHRPDDAALALTSLLMDPATASPAIRRMAGEYELEAGHPERALDHLRDVFASQPDDRRTLQGLLTAWQRLGRFDEARAMLDDALERAPEVHDLWLARLATESFGGDEARAIVARWLQAMPEHIPALEARMRLYDVSGDADAAEAVAHRIVELEPGRFSGEERIVDAWLQRDPDAAIAHVRQLIGQAPENNRSMLRNWLGWLQDRIGRYADAIETWSRLHGDQAQWQLPLPPVGATPAHWPALAEIPATQKARPLFVWGAPGAGAERVIAAMSVASRVVRNDRFSTQPPDDAFQRYATIAALESGRTEAPALIAEWRTRLPARGITDGNIIDWLLWWDNALLLALRPALPEGRLAITLRDPRDMLLDWIAFGAPAPLALASPLAAADWLARVLEQIADLCEQDLYPHHLLKLDGIENDPQAIAATLAQAFQHEFPAASSVGPARFPSGHWRRYAEALTEPFARLTPVAQRLDYPAT
ncbi:MAG: tetratricopeptide repeat protein [Xanthomonadaceae bacterium]|jgi:tetratricopeptide (TPR) repeat protein|nr:tetratricopeptide repeat protein [Xanthomonadaceae bacterium]